MVRFPTVSFVPEFNSLPLGRLLKQSLSSNSRQALASITQSNPTLTDFAQLISPAASEHLESLCRRSQQITQQRFGKVIRFFAPLYVSNECINNCSYCGFS